VVVQVGALGDSSEALDYLRFYVETLELVLK
jgi:hypothetical protein